MGAERGTERARVRDQSYTQRSTAQIPSTVETGSFQSQGLNLLHLQHRGQRANYLSHYLLLPKVHAERKMEHGQDSNLGTSKDMVLRCPMQCLNHCTKYPLTGTLFSYCHTSLGFLFTALWNSRHCRALCKFCLVMLKTAFLPNFKDNQWYLSLVLVTMQMSSLFLL